MQTVKALAASPATVIEALHWASRQVAAAERPYLSAYRRSVVRVIEASLRATGFAPDSPPHVLLEERVVDAVRVWLGQRHPNHRKSYRRAALLILDCVRRLSGWPNDEPRYARTIEAICTAGRGDRRPVCRQRRVSERLLREYPLLSEFITALQREGTYARSRAYVVRHFLRWWGSARDLAELSEFHLAKYMEHVQREPIRFVAGVPQYRSPNTVAQYAQALRSFLRWAMDRGYVDRPMWWVLADYRETHHERDIPTDGELRRYFMLLAKEPLWHRALKAVWLVTGLRVSEILSLRIASVDRERRALHVQEKGGRYAWVALTDEAWQLLQAYLSTRYITNDQEPLWVRQDGRPITTRILEKIERDLRTRAGWRPEIRGYHPLRHKYVEYISQAPLTRAQLQQQTRHASDVIRHRVYAHPTWSKIRTFLAAKGMGELVSPEELEGGNPLAS